MESSFVQLASEFFSTHQEAIWWLGVGSVLMLVASAAIVPIIVIRLPADFYERAVSGEVRMLGHHEILRVLVLLVKNSLGAVLLVAGILMLVLPGQGILTILIALALLNFPGKRALELRILRTPAIMKTLNWIRAKAGREPLRL